MSAERVQEANVSRTHTRATSLPAEEGPAEEDGRGECTQKYFKTDIFESMLVRIVFRNVLPIEGGEHIFENLQK